jgi:hypothetical protein
LFPLAEVDPDDLGAGAAAGQVDAPAADSRPPNPASASRTEASRMAH